VAVQEEAQNTFDKETSSGEDNRIPAGVAAWVSAVQGIMAKYGVIVVFALLALVFSVVNTRIFFTVQNAQTIAASQGVTAILSMAALLPLVAGQFDLSIGAQLGVAQAVCVALIVNVGVSPALAVVCTLAVGALFGLVNAILVVVFRINAFIATLATSTLGAGLLQMVTSGQVIFGNIPSQFLNLGRVDILGVPLPFIYVLVIALVLWIALEYTQWGRTCFATGGNRRAAQLAGVSVNRVTIQVFVLAGVLSACAGVLSSMILGVADPDVGPQYLLPAFAGALLGATSIRPGRFNIWGTVIAVYFLATGITGLQQLGVPSYVEQLFNGCALIVAVVFSQTVASRRRQTGDRRPTPMRGSGNVGP
jgi:ribose transport system permease protein